jgi:hypothetical protein
MPTQTVEAPRPRSENRQMQAVATARLSTDEMQRLRDTAAERGQSVSELIRHLVLEVLEA